MSSLHWLTHAPGISSSAGLSSCQAEGHTSDDREGCDHWCKSREGAFFMPRPIGVMDEQEGEERARKLEERMAERRRAKAADGSAPGSRRRPGDEQPGGAEQPAAEAANGGSDDRWQAG